jgi:general secretion pathway protein G
MAGGRGFTLVEVLVVLVVLGIVAALALVALFNALDKAKQRATMADMRSISRAIEAYAVDHGFPPASSAGTVAELVPLLVPYQSSVLPHRDHWGHEILYERDGSGNYTIVSLGKDGADGPDISYDTRFEFDRDIVLANGQFIASPE